MLLLVHNMETGWKHRKSNQEKMLEMPCIVSLPRAIARQK